MCAPLADAVLPDYATALCVPVGPLLGFSKSFSLPQRYLLPGSTRGTGEPFAPHRLMAKFQALVGFYLPTFYDRPELIGQITSRVDEVLPLNPAAEAHRRLKSSEVRGVWKVASS
jgi:hypothetical protein